MLETERYGEAMALLDFLLHCQGQSEQQMEEWESLLGWLRMSFPEAAIESSALDQQEDEENHTNSDTIMRDRIKGKQSADHSYESKLLETLQLCKKLYGEGVYINESLNSAFHKKL